MGFAWKHFGVVAEGLLLRAWWSLTTGLLGFFLKWAMSKMLYIAFPIVIYRGNQSDFGQSTQAIWD